MINIDAREYDWPKRTSDRLADLERTDLGGPGSGNFGHAGRPGEVGGSAEGDGGDGGDKGQARAKAGGEYGPNREWYPGGAFIATSDMPKRERDKIERLAKKDTELVDFGQRQKIEPGQIPIWRDVGATVNRDFTINETYLDKAGFDDEYKAQIREAAARARTGERLFDIKEFPALATVADVVRLIAADQPVPGDALDRITRYRPDLGEYLVRATATTKTLSDQSRGAPTSINLPDISDVSFPEIVGAIAPTVPKRKKRKRALYKGISLSRRPMKFEAQVLSLTEIPKRLDLARDGLVLHADDDALLQETMQDIASYGAREVLVELTRQGAPAQLVDRPVVVDVDGIYAGLMADRARALTLLREDYEARLGRRRIGAERKAALTREFTDVRRPSLLKRFANRAVNEAFAFGRAQAIQALRRSRMPTEYELAYRDESGRFISTVEAIAGGEAIVDAVIQTAVMDTGTCDECAEVDGEQMELGSDRQEELRPPYVKCAGGDHCRCIQIAILADGTEVDVSDVDEDTIE